MGFEYKKGCEKRESTGNGRSLWSDRTKSVISHRILTWAMRSVVLSDGASPVVLSSFTWRYTANVLLQWINRSITNRAYAVLCILTLLGKRDEPTCITHRPSSRIFRERNPAEPKIRLIFGLAEFCRNKNFRLSYGQFSTEMQLEN